MPSVDFLGAVTMGESPVLGSLKMHKTLPRVETRQKGTFDNPQGDRRLKRFPPSQARENPSDSQSNRLRSWIHESTDIYTEPVAGRPLTPPIDFRDNFKSWIDDKALKDRKFLSKQKIDHGNSSLMTDSPSTSRVIPAKHKTNVPTADPFSNIRRISGGTTGTFPESRTESFTTARENISSDEESYPLDSPSLHPSRQKWLRATALSHTRDIGLGLGLETEDEQSLTPKDSAHPKNAERLGEDFMTFDGTWNPYTVQEIGDTDSQVTARRDSDEKVKSKLSVNKERAQSDSPTLGVETRETSQKALGARRRQEKGIQELSAKDKSVNGRKRQSTKQSQDDTQPSDSLHAGFRDIKEKRLSQASTSSTVVEAMVIESSPPYRRPSLRHTGKLLMLDAMQDHQQHSHQNLIQLDDTPLKHSLRSSKNADQALRECFASETMPAKAAKSALTKSELSNVVVIPDRRSSLQSSTNSSKRLSRTFSVNSKPQSSRPTTAPENAVGYFDVPRGRRTLSVVIQQASPVKKAEQEISPSSHPNGSLAAAAATKDLARTTSITSRGMTSHLVPQTPTSPGLNPMQIADTYDNQAVKGDRSNSGDWTALRPTSTIVTPYSLRSYSSTPGALEVNEATAISIFPHTNRSILVIHESAGGDGSSPVEQSALIAGNASIGLPSKIPPLISQPFITNSKADITDSSLQNPRQPPSVPGFKVIPPTPANAASSSEDTVRHMRHSKRVNRFSTPFASLRRAISARRYSESIINPFVFTRTLSLRDTTSHRRPRLSDDNKDNQLHPFWRPRTTWDNSDERDSDSDSEFGNPGMLSPQTPTSNRTTHKTKKSDDVEPNPKRNISLTRRITNSLRSETKLWPVPRRASTSLTADMVSSSLFGEAANMGYNSSDPRRTQSLTRRIGGSLRLPSTSTPRYRRPRRSSTADWNGQPNYEFVPAAERQNLVEEPSSQSRNIGFQNLAERIERRRSLREEFKREERRQVLKGQIKPLGIRDPDLPDRFSVPQTSRVQHPRRQDRPEVRSWMDGPDNDDE